MNIFFNKQKKLQKLIEFSRWIKDVFNIGMNTRQKQQFEKYNNEINNTRHVTREFYSDYKRRLLSLAVAVEYRDNEDTTGERRKKIYKSYRKHNGKVHNDLLVLIDYVLRFFSENNIFLNEIRVIERNIISQNETMMNYKDYLYFKVSIILNVSHGLRHLANDGDLYNDDLYKVIAQRYERGQQETQEQIQRALKKLQKQRQTNKT